jgi:hypothetical protein
MSTQLRSGSAAIVAALLLLCTPLVQAKTKYACDEPQPADLCNAANTCGSATETCTVDIRKSGDGATVKPGIPNAKSNKLFCIKAGTMVKWMTSSKNGGFSVFFGTDSPFTPDDPIVGGGSKPITVKAEKAGCYKYDAGAFYSGAVYGMGAGSQPELVVIP